MPLRLVKLLVSLSLACADSVRAAIGRRFGREPARQGVVLYYHAVRAEHRRRFARQMSALARLSVPIDIESGEPLPTGRRWAAVTFDDAFTSAVENALPELRARRIPCVVFVPTGSIGLNPSWIRPSHEDAAEVVAPAEVVRRIADPPLVRIGSHSVSHPDFRQLDDLGARDELVASKAALEAIVGREVRSFSFPHGAYTRRSLDLAKQCGYTNVFSIDPVPLTSPQSALAIGRIRVDPDDWPIEFRLKVLGAYRWASRASEWKRRLLGLRAGRARVPPMRRGR